jgi:hypothetical protein
VSEEEKKRDSADAYRTYTEGTRQLAIGILGAALILGVIVVASGKANSEFLILLTSIAGAIGAILKK